MNIARPVMFWVATLAVGIAAAPLLRDILLPFAAGILLAYLLDAPVNRLERIGFNRAAAAWPLAARASRMSIRSGSDREGVNRRIDWPGRIVRSERTL